jgi:hypothetical protein
VEQHIQPGTALCCCFSCRYVAAVSSNAAGVPTKEKRAQELAEKAKKVSSSSSSSLEGGWPAGCRLCAALLAAGGVRQCAAQKAVAMQLRPLCAQ